MATLHRGLRATTPNIIPGPGALRGILVSHAQPAPQTVTLYDNTAASGTVLATLRVQPTSSPFLAMFSVENAPRFDVGLSWTGPNCELNVWALEF